jgi:hypothetical protein
METGMRSEAPSSSAELVRELDHRVSDRIDVWLRWRPSDDLVFVEVADGRTNERFVVEVAERERPLDVFRHPYAYAADRRIDLHADAEA